MQAFTLALLASVAVAVADASDPDYHAAGSCLGISGRKRMCTSRDSAADVSNGLCRPNELNVPELRLCHQNWPSTWLMNLATQVILSEKLNVPVVIDSGGSKAGDASQDFYAKTPSESNAATTDYNWDGIKAASKTPKCTGADTEAGKSCCHSIIELWSGQDNAMRFEENAGTSLRTGALGTIGRLSMFITTELLKLPGFGGLGNYRGLKDRSIVKQALKRPMTWGEFCATTNCSSPAVANNTVRPPATAAENASFYVDNLYFGAFEETSKGNVIAPPCGWTNYVGSLLYNNGLQDSLAFSGPSAQGFYSYGEMVQVHKASAAQKEGIMFWWWEPDSLLAKWKTQGAWFRLEKLYFPLWSPECEAKRPGAAACNADPLLNNNGTCSKCAATMAQQGMSWNGEDQAMGCDYKTELLMKSVTSSLPDYLPQAMHVLRNVFFTAPEQDVLVGDAAFSGKKIRTVVCDWVKSNEKSGGYWSNWLPRTSRYPQTLAIVTVSTGTQGAINALGVVQLIAAACTAAFVFLYKARRVVRYAQPVFLFVLLAGICLLALFPIFSSMDPGTTSCTAAPCVAHVGFMLVFLPLLAKEWRVIQIFNNKKLKKKIVKASAGLTQTAAGIVIMATLVAIWASAAEPKDAVTETVEGNVVTRETSCMSTETATTQILSILIYGYEAITLIIGCILSFQSRRIPSEFGESRWIALAIYNTFFCAAIAGAMSSSGALDGKPDLALTVKGLCEFAAAIGMILLIFGNKAHKVFFKVGDVGGQFGGGGAQNTHTSQTMSESEIEEEEARARAANAKNAAAREIPVAQGTSTANTGAPAPVVVVDGTAGPSTKVPGVAVAPESC